MEMTTVFKIIFLVLAILYGFGNFVRIKYRQAISALQMILMTIGIVGFLVLQWGL